jgi:hypothetical protein
MSGNQIKRPLQNLTIADYHFKSVTEFTHVGAFISDENEVEDEIPKE